MIANLQRESVLSCFKQGMPPEDIAIMEDLDIEVVKLIIRDFAGVQSLDRQDMKREDLISDEDEKLLATALKNIAFTSENDSARVKAAIYLINEKRGRNDIKSTTNVSGGINITVINDHMRIAREVREKALKKLEEKKSLQSLTSNSNKSMSTQCERSNSSSNNAFNRTNSITVDSELIAA